jgi:hypothetical protein
LLLPGSYDGLSCAVPIAVLVNAALPISCSRIEGAATKNN